MKKILAALCFVAVLMTSTGSFALEHHEEPSDMGILVDVVFLRPVGLAVMAAGFGIFVAALPYAIVTNSVDGTAKALLKKPFEYVFVRDVGDI